MKKNLIALILGFSLLAFSGNAKSANLVVNGDFEQGNVGIKSDFQYESSGASNVLFGWPPRYVINSNPSNVHSLFANMQDHSVNGTKMFILNGGPSSNQNIVWEQTVSVSQNTLYDFSAWTAAVYNSSYAQLNFYINGYYMGQKTVNNYADWQKSSFSWNSLAATNAIIQIMNGNNEWNGNDFALDDISLSASTPSAPTPEPSSMVLGLMGLGSLLGFRRKKAA